MEEDVSIYAPSSSEGALRQGQIITDLVQFRLDLDSIDNEDSLEGHDVRHPFAVVMTQDCDLVWDFKARQQEDQDTIPEHRLLPNILFCETSTAENLKGREGMNSKIWKTIKNNKDERYHFLQKVLPEEDAIEEGLPELAIDFKRYFTIPTAEVYSRLMLGAICRCKLVSPYLEHLSSRFYAFQSRVALPSDHFSE